LDKTNCMKPLLITTEEQIDLMWDELESPDWPLGYATKDELETGLLIAFPNYLFEFNGVRMAPQYDYEEQGDDEDDSMPF